MNNQDKSTVHYILLHSYLMFLVAVIFGVILDTIFREKIFSNEIYQNIGFFMMIIGPMFIYWAQRTSKNYKQKAKRKELKNTFGLGPYKYLRSPTHFGLFIMTLGFSLVINSLFGVILTIFAHIVTKVFFLKKEEVILERKYGEIYTEYKKRVKNWL